MKIETGTIICGTMLNEEIAPALLDYLVNMGKNGILPVSQWAELDTLAKQAHANMDELVELDGWETDECYEIVEDLFDSINGLLPEGYYCGSLEGDGADFGVWEEIEE